MGNVFDGAGKELHTPASFHPGKFLQEEMEERKLNKVVFARQLDLLPDELNALLKGKRNIDAPLAAKLEKVLKISTKYWLGLQSAYDLAAARSAK